MDYNVALYTTELDAYVGNFTKDSIPHLVASWPGSSGTWTSVFVNVPKSQMIIELVGKSTTLKSSLPLEPRMTQVTSSPPDSNLLTPVSVSRLVGDMDSVDDFYQNGVEATQTQKYSEGSVTRHCYQWSGA